MDNRTLKKVIKFDKHQLRLWNDMLRFIDLYTEGKILFSGLVGSLEGAFDAGDLKDKGLIKQWYSFWGPLETYNAVKLDTGEPVIKEEVMKYVKAMREFLIEQLKKNAIK